MRQSVKLLLIGLFVFIVITQLGHGECDQHSNESPTTITLSLWILNPEPQVVLFVISTLVSVELPSGPPITSAFDQNFLWAKYYIVPSGNQYLPTFKICYSTITNETEAKVDASAREFLTAFNYSDLENLTQSFDNNTCTFTRQYKYLNNTETVMKNFVKFVPQTGNLINNFINLYTPGNDSMRLMRIEYDLDSERHWTLTILSSVVDVFTPGKKTIDLKELLNATNPIATSGDISSIMVNIENRAIGSEEYTIVVKDVSQSGYTISPENESVTYVWQLKSNELEDLTIAVELDINKKTNNQNTILPISVVAVAALIIIFIVVRKNRKKRCRVH